jgi:hypothetical protein
MGPLLRVFTRCLGHVFHEEMDDETYGKTLGVPEGAARKTRFFVTKQPLHLFKERAVSPPNFIVLYPFNSGFWTEIS